MTNWPQTGIGTTIACRQKDNRAGQWTRYNVDDTLIGHLLDSFESDLRKNLATLMLSGCTITNIRNGVVQGDDVTERLTYHEHPNPMLRDAFLITYRTFCTPDELLDLLIKV